MNVGKNWATTPIGLHQPAISAICAHHRRAGCARYPPTSGDLHRRTRGLYAENLAWVSALLDRCPNFHVDISARIGELGRHLHSQAFLYEIFNRILFGSDMGPSPEAYRVIYRFLETDDEHFNYNASIVPEQRPLVSFTACTCRMTFLKKYISAMQNVFY